MQVERPGFRRELAPELALERPNALLARLRSVPGVAAAAPRVQAQGLASTAAKSEGIMLVGIDPLAERGVTFIDRTLVEGQALAPGAQREAMIGRELAQKLRLKLGEKIVVMAQAADGELGTAAYRVSGIFATESASFDGAFVFVTLGVRRGNPGERAELVLHQRGVDAEPLLALERDRVDRVEEIERAPEAPHIVDKLVDCCDE